MPPGPRHPRRAALTLGALAGLCWLLALDSLARPAAPLAVAERALDYPGSEGEMPAHLYTPDTPGRHPAVLVLHTLAGPGPNVEAFARRLASHGFVTLTPDLFALHEFGAGGPADHPLVLADLDGALRFLRDRPSVDPTRIGVVGFSFGGRLAVIAAARHPTLRAAVVYYAVASYQELARDRPVAGRALATRPLTELVASLATPVLIHHGEADRNIPAGQARLLHRSLAAAGKPAALFLYPGADHLFDFALGPQAGRLFDPDAAARSWERTLAFLRQHLGH